SFCDSQPNVTAQHRVHSSPVDLLPQESIIPQHLYIFIKVSSEPFFFITLCTHTDNTSRHNGKKTKEDATASIHSRVPGRFLDKPCTTLTSNPQLTIYFQGDDNTFGDFPQHLQTIT